MLEVGSGTGVLLGLGEGVENCGNGLYTWDGVASTIPVPQPVRATSTKAAATVILVWWTMSFSRRNEDGKKIDHELWP